MKYLKINKRLSISNYQKPLLVAEISANHAGSKKSFLKHIVEAKKSGADIVKIQTYEPEDITLKQYTNKFKIKKGTWKNKYLWNLIDQENTDRYIIERYKKWHKKTRNYPTIHTESV